MKKILIITLSVLMSVTLLAGCGNDKSDSSKSSSQTYSQNADNSSETSKSSSNEQSNEESKNEKTGLRELADEYEAFVDKYVEFMKKYKSASVDDIASMTSEYTEIMSELSEWTTKTSKLKQSDYSVDDWKYYTEVATRCLEKMSTVK